MHRRSSWIYCHIHWTALNMHKLECSCWRAHYQFYSSDQVSLPPPPPDPIFLSGFLMDFWRLAALFAIIWSAPLWGYQLKYQWLMASHSLDVSEDGVCSQYAHRLAVRGWQMSGIPELKGSALYLKLLTVWYVKQSAPFISAKYCYRKHSCSIFVLHVVLGVSSLSSEVRRWKRKVTETLYSVKLF